MPVFERRGLQRYELFRIPQIFFKFFKNFLPPRRSSKQPFSEAGCKGTLFSFTSKSFLRNFWFFLKRQYKSLAEMPLELQLNRREMTQRQKSGGRKVAEGKLRQKRGDRKEATEKRRQKDRSRTQKWRKPRKSRLVPDHSMWPGSAPEKHLPII